MIFRILKDSAAYTASALVARLVNFLLLPFYTRILSPGAFGAYDLMVAFGGLVYIVLPLEVAQGAARYTAETKDPAVRSTYASTALRFTLACYAGFALVCLPLAPLVTRLLIGDEAYTGIFRLAIAYIALNGTHALLLNQLKWELRSGAYAANHVLLALGGALASLAFAVGLGQGLAGIFHGLILATVLALAVGAWQLRDRLRGAFARSALADMLAYSVPLAAAGVGVVVNTYVDRVMLNRFLSLESVGVYGMALRIAAIASLATFGVQSALSPIVYSAHAQPDTPRQLARFFRLYAGGTLVLGLALALFAGDLLRWIAPPTYAAAAPLVAWLTASLLVAGMTIFAPGLNLAKKTGVLLAIYVAGGMLNLVLNFLLIPRLGMTGAALATLTASTTIVALSMLLGQRHFPVPYDWSRVFLGVVAVLALAALGARVATAGWASFGLRIVLVLLAAPLLTTIGLIPPAEWRAARERFRR